VGGFMVEFINENLFEIIEVLVVAIMFIAVVTCNFRLRKLNKNYKTFIKKLGNGEDIEEILKKYLQKVEAVEVENVKLRDYCKRLNEDMMSCIQKVGVVRYSAFKDTGSDLSFALALLDERDNGVVLNGIYSREMSNIYAKQIINGKTSSKLSEEEEQAMDIAVNNGKAYKIGQ
jgi:hypothetical protein